MSHREVRAVLDAMLATFCLHVESRVASLLGLGYYTIGPCGEEALASAAFALLHPNDSVALHYRHLAINVARLLLLRHEREQAYEPLQSSLSQLLLDRARGYAVSRYDPVTSGVHCSLGSSHHSSDASPMVGGDFIVTSTLASQCSPAVGRALAYAMVPNGSHHAESGRRPVSFVTVGDGSVHNAHFWSAFHLARHARHRGVKCPVVFGVADNGLSISYETQGYVDTLFASDPLVPLFVANGSDAWDVHDATSRAVAYARTRSAPAVVLYKNLVRRFGHAATDRQASYLTERQIQRMAENAVLERNMTRAVRMGAATYPEILRRFAEIQEATTAAFEAAVNEPKVNRDDMLRRVAAPAVPVPRLPEAILCRPLSSDPDAPAAQPRNEMMRKLMNRVIGEALESDPSVVYMGEDVRHGGYYAVTEGLAEQFPARIVDFPPDETSLLGSALGFAQSGLTPIVEIPYAKYLDCGADMFAEIALSHWLTGESRRHSGMLIRLQGFDRGLFGGNFHTHNSLAPPPGVDMLCYSNGEDYVRGFRNAMIQAKAGRVVVLVECTHLLNLRHLFDKDRAWERPFPPNDEHGPMGFDDVRQFGKTGKIAIVTYGNGVVTALQARRALYESMDIESESFVDIIDCPCVRYACQSSDSNPQYLMKSFVPCETCQLSRVPSGLSEVIGRYSGMVFADVCKLGPGTSVLSSAAVSLHDQGKLPAAWRSIAAQRTYNPLGSVSTFLNVTDIVESTRDVLTCIH
jgi:2-oxoisovalerate dehydrogenase E1 component